MKNIKKLRENTKLTQQEVVSLAKKINGGECFTQSQLCLWEKGKADPSDKNVELLCQIFKVSKEELLYDDDLESRATLEGHEFGKRIKTEELKTVMKYATDTNLKYRDKFLKVADQLLMIASIRSLKLPPVLGELQSNENEWALKLLVMSIWNASFENK